MQKNKSLNILSAVCSYCTFCFLDPCFICQSALLFYIFNMQVELNMQKLATLKTNANVSCCHDLSDGRLRFVTVTL